MKLKIELDLNDLINTARHDHHDHHESTQEPMYLPLVPAGYNTLEGLNNSKVWYQTYDKDSYKWIRMEGRGENPMACTDIIIRVSPGNTDTLIDEKTYQDMDGKTVKYDDYPEDIFVQSERLRQLEQMSYVEGEDNFRLLVD